MKSLTSFCIAIALLSLVILTVGAGGKPARGQTPATTTPSADNDPKAQDEASKFWLHAREEVDRSVLELIAQNQTEIDRGLRFHKLMHGDARRKEIALTFDDGPHPKFTPQLLELLRKSKVKATFFLVGELAEKYPDLVRAEVADGHCVGNHTFHHVNLTRIPQDYVATEIKACGEVLQNIIGEAPHFFRPPGGDYDKQVAEASSALGYTMVLWTDDPGDYASPGAKVIQQRILKRISNGGIILVHDGIPQTMDILPGLISYLKSKGYTFVTIDEMVKNQKIGNKPAQVKHDEQAAPKPTP